MAGKKAQANKHRKEKYASHPARAIKNKLRKMLKHLKKHPNDLQTKAKV